MFADEGMGREFMDAIVIQRRCRPCSAPPAGTATRSEAAAGCPAVEVYPTGGQSMAIRIDHSLYRSLSAMKNLEVLSQMHADEKPPQMFTDDYSTLIRVQQRDRAALQATPDRFAVGTSSRTAGAECWPAVAVYFASWQACRLASWLAIIIALIRLYLQ